VPVPRKYPVLARNDAPVPNPGNARWCETHTRLECAKNKHGRVPCHAIAIKGTNACTTHSGKLKELAIELGQATITAWTATGTPTIDHRLTVLRVLEMSWLRLQAYARILESQVVKDGESTEGDDETHATEEVQGSGLIGYRYGMGGKDGIVYRQTEEVRALVILEAAERDRVVRYAKTAHDMGISDRMLDIAATWTQTTTGKVMSLLDALQLTPEQWDRVPALIDIHFTSIENDPGNPIKAIAAVGAAVGGAVSDE
jgi:hypothetical protein